MSDFLGEKYLYNGEVKLFSEWDDQVLNGRPLIYDVIRVEEGVPLFFEDYFERLTNSFLLVNKKPTFNYDLLNRTIKKLLEINNCSSAPVKFLFQYQKPEIFIAYLMKPHLPLDEEYDTGVITIFLHQERINPNAKVWNQKTRESTILKLQKADAYEGILVDEEGYVTEGSRSNIFFIKHGILYTTPNDFILPGITRKKVLHLCESNGISVKYQRIHTSQVSSFDSAFLTGTSRKVLPIKSIDAISFSVDNKTMSKIILEFENLVVNYINQVNKK